MRRTIAVLGVVWAVLFGLGLESGHAQHELDHEFGAPARFDAGHDAPISEEHVESARRLHEESCPACALQSSSTSASTRASGQRVPLLAGRTNLESTYADRQYELSLLLGRAPPLV